LLPKIATGEIVDVDASLIRTNVNWESLARRHVEAVARANEPAPEEETKMKGRQTGRYEVFATPSYIRRRASMTTSTLSQPYTAD
jgi:hypothetical protein